jgi:SWI/SNF-related matrix-associated actin-dependent regulator of chromatin subfamily A-like protein 1
MNCRRCDATLVPFDAGLLAGPVEVCVTPECFAKARWEQRRARLEVFPFQEVRRCSLLPFLHQFDGIELLHASPFFLLADEMGVAKTFQAIVAAQLLYLHGHVNRVIVLAPAAARHLVWYHPEMGELARHLWPGLPIRVTEYHARIRQWTRDEMDPATSLKWIVTNYDYIRAESRTLELLKYCDDRTVLICDESSAVKNHTTLQARAAFKLRKYCGRVWLINGTPIANSPGDMLSQGNLMHPRILDCPSITQFRAQYAVMAPVLGPGGRARTNKWGGVIKVVKSWQHLDVLQQKFAPYVVRRLKKDCLDLPEKFPSIPLTVNLGHKAWAVYKEMRDECLAWLGNHVSQSPQAATVVLRLAQITSGFLGGMEEIDVVDHEANLHPQSDMLFQLLNVHHKENKEIGREKLEFLLERLQEWWLEDPNLKVLVWCRFRPEILRLAQELRNTIRGDVGVIIGQQTPKEREDAVRLLDPRTAVAGPAVVVGSPGAGGKALTLTAAHTVVFSSNDYNLETRLQAEDRTHRQSQEYPVSYFDLVAYGPSGQRTIDLDIIRVLTGKDHLATRTSAAWVKTLVEVDD